MVAWVPLESNPEVLNKLMDAWGASGPFEWVDIFGLDEELLAMAPQPVLAVLLLYPVDRVDTQVPEGHAVPVDGVFYTRQTIQNACGSIGVLHAVLNNIGPIHLTSPLKEFYEATKGLSAEQRASELERNDAMRVGHESCANGGQTQAPDAEDDVDLHFVCFVHENGRLIELDGRKQGPVNHGTSSPETLLSDTAKVVHRMIEKDPSLLQMNLMALASTQ